jgi:DNA-binding NarL/FixJ family response regulator
MRILWVENHAVFARIAGGQFLSAHDLTLVGTLAGAPSALRIQAFDAILLDYDLDDGKGVDLLESLKQLSPRPAVIAASVHQDGNDALLGAGADAVCSKGKFAEIETILRRTVESALRSAKR